MKRLFLLTPLLIIGVLLVGATAPVLAALKPSGDGKDHIVVTLTGTNSPSQYTVKGTQSIGGQTTTSEFTLSGSSFTSGGFIAPSGPCQDTATTNNYTIHISVYNSADKLVGSDPFSLCSQPGGPYIFADSIHVGAVSQDPASFMVESLTYKSAAGNQVAYGSGTKATLVGGPSHKSYPVKFDDQGNSQTVHDLQAGTYTFTADYNPNNPSDSQNKHYTKTVTIKAGQAYVLNGLPATSDSSSGKDTDTAPECEASGFSLSWILCPIFNMFSDTAHWIFQSIVQPFLITTPISTDPNDPSYQIWSNFRIYGDIFLVIALLVIVFGQAIGGGLVDAYTAKKVLPRLLAAVILINLSLYIVAFMVDITNVLGAGISNIMTAPLTHCSSTQISNGNCWDFRLSNTDIASVFGVGLIGFIIGSTAIVGFLGALFFGGGAAIGTAVLTALLVSLPMIIAAIGVFITLIFRKGLILFLVLVSPVAFALYCLPNTERYFKRWWELLVEALLVYPIVIIIFGVADILTITILSANNISPSSFTSHLTLDASRTLALIVAFFLQFLPLLAIPFAFRFASGALRRIYDAATTAGAKANQLANNRREQAKMDWKSNTLAARARSYQGMQALGGKDTSKLGIGRRLANMGARRAGGYNIEALMSAARAEKAKQVNDQIATGRDEEIRGLTVNKAKALKGRSLIAAGRDTNGDTIWRDGANNEVVSGAALENYDYRVGADGSREFQSLGGAWVSEGAVDAGQRRWGRDQFAQQAALSYEMRKGVTDGQRSRIKNGYMDLATSQGGWGMSGGEARGAWQGSAFENQNTNLEYKYTKFNDDGSQGFDYDQYVTEIDEKRGSYNMSQMDASSIDRLTQAWGRAGDNPEQQAKLKRIAETMQDRMTRARTGGPEVAGGGEGEAGGQQATALGPGHVSERMSEFVRTVLP
jgi:hypothetical protein